MFDCLNRLSADSGGGYTRSARYAQALAAVADLPAFGEANSPDEVLAGYARDPLSVPQEVRSLPGFKLLVSSFLQERREALEQKREQVRRRRNAQARARRVGLRAWPAALNKDADLASLAWFEQEMLKRGWLDLQDSAQAWGWEDAQWTLRIPVADSVREQVVRAGWLEPLLAQMGRNPDALELAMLLGDRGAASRGAGRVPAPVARKMLQAYQAMAGAPGSLAQLALARLTFTGWRALSRVPSELRWALLDGKLGRSGSHQTRSLALRDLNWARYAQARTSPLIRLQVLPPHLQWERLTGLPAPRYQLPSLYGIKVATLKRILSVAGLMRPAELKKDQGTAWPIVNLVRLFGDEASIRRYVLAKGLPWDRKGLHDAGQFTLPEKGWTPAKWAPLCLRHPNATAYAREFAKLEQAGLFPTSWSALQDAVLRRSYPKPLPGMEGLFDFCLQAKLSAGVFEEAQQFWVSAKVKTAEFLPAVDVRGAELGLSNDWRFFRLDSDDVRGPLLGHLTGCCQHLSGAGAACAHHGVQSPYSAFYVLTFKGAVFAQSWAWRGQRGAVVWDSIESKPLDADSLSVVARFYAEASKRLLQGPLGVTAVYLGTGDSGSTAGVAQALGISAAGAAVLAEPPYDECAYMDGQRQWVVASKGSRYGKASRLVEVQGYARTKPARATAARCRELERLWWMSEMSEAQAYR